MLRTALGAICSGRGPQGGPDVVGDRLIELGEQVPVAVEGHVDGRVAHAPLDRLRVGALRDGQGDGGVAEIVKTQPVESGGSPRRLPVPLVEDGPADRPAPHVDEHQPVPARLRAQRQLLLQLLRQERRDADGAGPSSSLGLLAHPPPLPASVEVAADEDQLLGHGDLAPQEIDARPAQADQLTPAHSRLDRAINERAKPRVDGLGEVDHFLRGQEAHLVGLHPGWLNGHTWAFG
jgi:hypothetical protein